MRPKEKFRDRPKKTGARKKQRVLTQKRRLIAVGYDKDKLEKMTIVDIRYLLRKVMKEGSPKGVRAISRKAKK